MGLDSSVLQSLFDGRHAEIRQQTREVLGRLASESVPDLLLCVADATNLRLVLRLLLELKQTGHPMVLVLNMIDIAQRRGVTFDLDKLSHELGLPVVTSIAVRKHGIEELLKRTDAVLVVMRRKAG